jgi:hypothetical protein
VVLTQSFDEIIAWGSRNRMPGAQNGKYEESAEEILHGFVCNGHLRHLKVIPETVIVKNLDTGRDLPPNMHLWRFVRLR